MGFANESRGLKLAGSNFAYLTEGAYGLIFVDPSAGRIRKVYRRKPNEQHVRDVFDAEAEAFRLAAKSDAVAALVPGGFTICAQQTMVDREGKDVSSELFGDLAFEVDFVSGSFEKIGAIASSEADTIRDLFEAAGIMHTSDMSVVVDEHGQIGKCIDFAVMEHEVWADTQNEW